MQLSSSTRRTLSSTSGSPVPDHEGVGPAFRSVTRFSPSTGASYNLKIVKANMKKTSRRVTFDTIHQMYVEITANMNYLTMAVVKKWGKGYTIVTVYRWKTQMELVVSVKFIRLYVRTLLLVCTFRSCILALSTEED